MASREKKTSLSKNKTASPVPPKENVTAKLSEAAKNTAAPQAVKSGAKTIRKKVANPKRVVKKSLASNLKAKGKITRVSKALINKGRGSIVVKKTLIKNGVAKTTKIIRKRSTTKPEKSNDQGDQSTVLEPVFPLYNNVDKKQIRKKTLPKKGELGYCSVTATIEEIVRQSALPTTRKLKTMKKPKEEPNVDSIKESIENVIREMNDTESNGNNSDQVKTVKKAKVEVLKKKIKKENIENSDIKVDSTKRNVIDLLDLNVNKIKNSKVVQQRRHSIEKFQITNQDVKVPDIPVFTNLPRSMSPKVKKPVKFRRSIESRKSSPYTTRSDSPARILRNGKHRKLKHLLEGLDSDYKKRKRLCSDYSGSEVSVSKLSGYESDSSFSDMASLHGSENPEQTDVKDSLVKNALLETVENKPPGASDENPEAFAATIKRSLSLDSSRDVNAVDTNSNLCATVNEETTETNVDLVDETVNPSFKVPEKSLILGIMKQTFNVVEVDEPMDQEERRQTRSSVKKDKDAESEQTLSTAQFYGSPPVLTRADEEEDTKNVEDEVTKAAEELESVLGMVDSNMGIGLHLQNFNELDEKPDDKSEIAAIVNGDHKAEVALEETKLEVAEDALVITEDAPEMSLVAPEIVQAAPEIAQVAPEIMQIDVERLCIDIKEPVQDSKKIELLESIEFSPASKNSETEDSPENLMIKSQILQALGLQSMQEAQEAKQKKVVPRTGSTGTLKTVIKLSRLDKKKGGRNSLKMTLQKKGRSTHGKDSEVGREEDEYKIMKEGTSSTWKAHTAVNQSSDSAGAQRKTHYSNRSNMDGSSEHTSDGDTAANEDGSGKVLVIPEKASSFSIHPGRLCKDECSYCFGKFGLFDTPCHLAQMKSVERQNNILATEKHLMRDSCLCDACYRHVDRKANTPSYTTNKTLKRNSLVVPGPRENHCHVLGCGGVATNILRRKWLIKMRKSVCQVINIDLDNPGLHSIPICEHHYEALEHLMVCAMCKRRLARNHVHYLGAESNALNAALNEMGIPVKLHDRPVVCKLCRYFATVMLRAPEDRSDNTTLFFKEYKRRLLHFHEVELMDDAQAEEPIPAPLKDKNEKDTSSKKRKRSGKMHNHLETAIPETEIELTTMNSEDHKNSSPESRAESPSDYVVDYNKLLPNIAIECTTDLLDRKSTQRKPSLTVKRITKAESIKEAVEKSKQLNRSDIAVQRLGCNPSISVRQLFPGEEELGLNANIDFHNVKERTPEGWEKCTTTIQYDPEIKMLWNELQKPYGNQSSFLRHLILLEKYFRNGDLLLSPNASHHSVHYTEAVQSRLRSYDNIPSNVRHIQPLTMMQFNKKPFTNIRDALPPSVSIMQQPLPIQQTPIPQASVVPAPALAPIREPTPLPLPTPPVSTPLLAPSPPPIIPITALVIPAATVITTTTVSQVSTPKIIPSTVPATVSTSTIIPFPIPSVAVTTVPISSQPSTSVSVTVAPAPPQPLPLPITLQSQSKSKLPPGLISLQPGTKIPVTPLVKVQPSQKIKFPITKNWRPNLIPIDPLIKTEKKPGLVQVISGGKPYHITVDDYKKMCAIKRTFDLRQKRLQEAQRNAATTASILKNIAPRKGLVISKASPTKDTEMETENSLEKLDRTVEKLEATLNDSNKPMMIMPKIPKSLTVIPQTVTKKTSRPSSPSSLPVVKQKVVGKS